MTSPSSAALGRLTDGRVIATLLVVVLCCLAVAAQSADNAPEVGSAGWATELLDELEVIDGEAPVPYDRDEYRGWLDVDGDCQHSRHEVLIAESLNEVTLSDDGCKVISGRWIDPYTGEVITQASDASIDHIVSLSESHHAGAWSWEQAWKQALYNDLEEPATLAVSDPRTNSSKGSLSPAEWLPSGAEQRCRYLIARVRVKVRWQLSIGSLEHEAMRAELQRCLEDGLPAEPDNSPLVIIDFSGPPPSETRPPITSDECDPHYANVCIPLVSFDLDCPDIEPRQFAVTGADPHGFDGDGNRIGCEQT